MSQLVRITSNGQVTIPIEIRKLLKIKAGSYLAVKVQGKAIRLQVKA